MRITSRIGRLLLATGLLVLFSGCATKTYTLNAPDVSSVEYAERATADLRVRDEQAKDDRALTRGTLNIVFTNAPDEGRGLLERGVRQELAARGIAMAEGDGGDARALTLRIDEYRIRNHRTSGYTPFITYTRFAGRVESAGESHPVVSYFRNGKVPIWTFDEVQKDTLDIPFSLLVKEVATKINRYTFDLRAPDAEVDRLTAAIDREFTDYTYLKVLELGYTNNPAAITPLMRYLDHGDSLMRASAAASLGMLGASEAMDRMIEQYRNSGDGERLITLKAIGDLDTDASRAFLKSIQDSGDYGDRRIREVVDLFIEGIDPDRKTVAEREDEESANGGDGDGEYDNAGLPFDHPSRNHY